MRQPQIYTSWMITCHSPEEAQSLTHWLYGRIDLDRVLTVTVRTYPNAVEQVQSVPHRLGDYFADIRILPALTPSAFRLGFHRLPGADRFWKDLMVNILQEIGAIPEITSITLDYKGDEEAVAAGGNVSS
jgi:hypothetical protein